MINKCLNVWFPRQHTHIRYICNCMREVCMQCTQYYICLELLTPTDSESLPWGRWRGNGKGTRELWVDRKRENQSDRHRLSKVGGRETGNKSQWERMDESESESLHWACSFTMWAADVKKQGGKLVSGTTRASQVSCGGSHAPPPLQLAHYLHQFVTHVCEKASGDGWMNDRTIEQAARASVQLWLLVCCWLSFSASFIQKGAIVERCQRSLSVPCCFEDISTKLQGRWKHWRHTSLI